MMKKVKSAIAAFAVMFACTGLAQAAPVDQTTTGPQRGNKPCGCVAGKQMNADRHLEMMTACLGLSEDQQAKIKPLLEENFKQKQAVRTDKNLTREQRRAKMQELRVQLHEKVKPLLTPEQNGKITNMWTKKAHHGKCGKGHGKPGHHGKDFRMDPAGHLAKMTACLGLSTDQQAKIKPLLEDNFIQKQAVRADKSLTREQRRAKMSELRTQLHEKVKPLLTPEQQKKCESHMGCQAKQPMKGNCPLMK